MQRRRALPEDADVKSATLVLHVAGIDDGASGPYDDRLWIDWVEVPGRSTTWTWSPAARRAARRG